MLLSVLRLKQCRTAHATSVVKKQMGECSKFYALLISHATIMKSSCWLIWKRSYDVISTTMLVKRCAETAYRNSFPYRRRVIGVATEVATVSIAHLAINDSNSLNTIRLGVWCFLQITQLGFK